MPPVTSDAMTVDELAARAGLTVRTIRFYGTRGLLPPPTLGPRRVGQYGPEHLSRLALIEELRQHGMTLAAIERYLRQLPPDLSPQDLAIHRGVVASWAPGSPRRVSRQELTRRAGRPLTEDDLDRLAAMDVLVPTATADHYEVDAGLLPLGLRLLELPLTLRTIEAARTLVQRHARDAARELSRLFRQEVWEPYREGDPAPEQVESLRSLSAQLQPMVVQALVTAFQRSLREEVRASSRRDPATPTAPRPRGTPTAVDDT